jgi:hypothetical protein
MAISNTDTTVAQTVIVTVAMNRPHQESGISVVYHSEIQTVFQTLVQSYSTIDHVLHFNTSCVSAPSFSRRNLFEI